MLLLLVAVCYTCLSCKTTRRIPAPPIHDPSILPELTSANTPSSTQPAESASAEPDAMVVDASVSETTAHSSAHTRKGSRKKGPKARLPPLFERDVGHVVFRGNERIA